MTEPTEQGGSGSAEESLERAERLLARLEQSRARLEATDDPEAAIDVLTELAEIAKQIEREIAAAKRRAEIEEEPGAEH
jgi:exonuclease VII small subunit